MIILQSIGLLIHISVLEGTVSVISSGLYSKMSMPDVFNLPDDRIKQSQELTRVNPDRNIFSINVELTSTFFTLQRFGLSLLPNFKCL